MADKKLLTFGVKLVLNQWDLLRLAVTQGFSGKDSDEETLDNLLNDILDNLLLYSLFNYIIFILIDKNNLLIIYLFFY